MAGKLDSPCPTPEALVSIKLRRVEENQPATQTQESIGIESNQMDDGPHRDAEDDRNEEVRRDRQKSELASGPLQEGPGVSNLSPEIPYAEL